MKKKTQDQPNDCLFQIITNHEEKNVTTTLFGREIDFIFALGVAFEKDPETYLMIKNAINLYEQYKNINNE